MIQFFVTGVPKSGGSKYATTHKHTGRVVVMESMPKENRQWRDSVICAARQAYDGPLLEGPLVLTITFYMPRPKGHYGTGKNAGRLKDSAPIAPITRPDASKLTRSTEDSLTFVLWKDDAQIVDQHVSKRYAGGLVHPSPGAVIEVAHFNGVLI